MEAGPPLPCPACQRPLQPISWRDSHRARCRHCEAESEFTFFPALNARRGVARSEAASPGDDATCFFHATNRAEAVCSGCGRLLCPVCAVDFGGRCLCPSCIAGRTAETPAGVNSRLLWDGIALPLAFLPLLMWPLTIVTAPTAIGLALYGWNKPSSLVRRSTRVRLVIAMLFATAQLVGWGIGLFYLLSR